VTRSFIEKPLLRNSLPDHEQDLALESATTSMNFGVILG